MCKMIANILAFAETQWGEALKAFTVVTDDNPVPYSQYTDEQFLLPSEKHG